MQLNASCSDFSLPTYYVCFYNWDLNSDMENKASSNSLRTNISRTDKDKEERLNVFHILKQN